MPQKKYSSAARHPIPPTSPYVLAELHRVRQWRAKHGASRPPEKVAKQVAEMYEKWAASSFASVRTFGQGS